MKIATEIKTEDWERIISGLLDSSWNIKMKYEGLDAGIDFNFIILEYNQKEIIFGWDNWVEGEIKCEDELMLSLENKFDIKFKYGEAVNLKKRVIALTKAQILFNRLRGKNKNR